MDVEFDDDIEAISRHLVNRYTSYANVLDGVLVRREIAGNEKGTAKEIVHFLDKVLEVGRERTYEKVFNDLD